MFRCCWGRGVILRTGGRSVVDGLVEGWMQGWRDEAGLGNGAVAWGMTIQQCELLQKVQQDQLEVLL